MGTTFPLFMDPLSIFPRILTLLVIPEFKYVFHIFNPDIPVKLQPPVVLQGAYNGAFSIFFLMLIIYGGAFFDRRFWCQYICPSGAFFGLMSRFSIFTRKTIPEKCTCCGICSKKSCPTRAISGEKFELTNTSECIVCGLCTADKRSCNSFSFTKPVLKSAAGPDLTRRELSAGIFTGLMLLPVLIRKSPKKRPPIPGPIRPPGAVEETAFIDRCITCSACVRVCPENALHPATLADDGLISWNTPKLVPRIGYCRKECANCSNVCPTGALLPLSLEKKYLTKIGTAVIDHGTCRTWQQQAACLICTIKCPYIAIDTKEITVEGIVWKVPVVDNIKCIGCGVCEYYCPVQHHAAIEVSSFGERRIVVHKKKPNKVKV
jgi:MauM/NapG family ferredoxin protein